MRIKKPKIKKVARDMLKNPFVTKTNPVKTKIKKRKAAIALAESNRKARLAMLERDKERNRDRQMTDLHYRARQAELWQSNFDAAARNAVAYRARQTLMSELENMLSPPAPPETLPHTQTVVVSEDEHGSPRLGDRDFNPKLWTKI
jgi:hypothetical protein